VLLCADKEQPAGGREVDGFLAKRDRRKTERQGDAKSNGGGLTTMNGWMDGWMDGWMVPFSQFTPPIVKWDFRLGLGDIRVVMDVWVR